MSVPKEKYVKMKEKNECIQNKKDIIDLASVIKKIYQSCRESVNFIFSDEANQIYESLHDEVIDFRAMDEFEEAKSSVKSKSIGLFLRISGEIISLIRKCRGDNPCLKEDNKIEKSDAEMALQIVNYSVANAFCLVPSKFATTEPAKPSSAKPVKKPPLPEPENLTIEYLQQYQKVTKRILQHEKIHLSKISKDKVYPIINDISGAHIANKFVNGLQRLGFGAVTPTAKHFKRYHPDDAGCPDRESLRKKYKLMNLL